MKKLTLGLVLLFVCGMVGEAGAALSGSESFLTDSASYTGLVQNQQTIFSFDLFASHSFDTNNIAVEKSGPSWINQYSPNPDSNLDSTKYLLSTPSTSNPFKLTIDLSGTSSLSNGAALNVYLYNSLDDAKAGTNSFYNETYKISNQSSYVLDFSNTTGQNY